MNYVPEPPLKQNEAVFRNDIILFLRELNETENCDEAYQCLVRLADSIGFPVVVYEYSHDHTRDNDTVFSRSNLPSAFVKMERFFSGRDRIMEGRKHARDFLTMGVSGAEFADMFEFSPEYVRKLKVAKMFTGLGSGFGVPLRTPSPKARAGFVFGSKMNREECLGAVAEHGMMLTVAAMHTHMRILQLLTLVEERPVFTEKQLRYVQLLCDGLQDKQISAEMNISYSAVRKHQMAVAAKLGVAQRAHIVAEAMKRGYLEEGGTSRNPELSDIWDVKVTTD